jgi:putative resolvase
MADEYINTSEAKTILRITPQTLRSWVDQNKIRIIRSPSNQRLYNKQDVYKLIGVDISHRNNKSKVIYCRVSSKKQMDDLERQRDFLKSIYPFHVVITDVGSGLNWKRKGLKTILEQSMRGDIEEIVVAHRDRLCRFAFELLEFVFQQSGCKLVVHSEECHKSRDEELADDILSIIHIYSCRKMGKRRYSNAKNKDISNIQTKTHVQKLDGNC